MTLADRPARPFGCVLGHYGVEETIAAGMMAISRAEMVHVQAINPEWPASAEARKAFEQQQAEFAAEMEQAQ